MAPVRTKDKRDFVCQAENARPLLCTLLHEMGVPEGERSAGPCAIGLLVAADVCNSGEVKCSCREAASVGA